MRPVNLRAIAHLFALFLLTSCAVGAGATIGLHYTTDQGVRVQLEVPLEADLVGAGASAADRGKPYLRGAVIPQLFYYTKSGKVDGGVRAAGGPVIESHGYWLSPAITVGVSGFRSNGLLDVGTTIDLDIPYSNGASCDDLRFNNLLVPQINITRHVRDIDHPLSSAGGSWDFGIAAGLRHIRFVTCGGASNVAPATLAPE